jgi:3-dehydroquinate synthetase
VPRAPENVFVFRSESDGRPLGWRNVFQLPIQYDVELCPRLLSLESSVLATRMMLAGARRRRFLVVDAAVQELYGAQIAAYFEKHSIETHTVVLPGEECNKRMEAVDAILEQLCVFGLLRREPVIGIGGGVLLDIVGLAANLYRRGVPYIRVPTTLLSLVDASVGVKNGVDYCSCSCGPQKNRVGSFYAPAGALLDKTFIATQDARNVINGLGEIMKLALVRSTELFCLLETHGPRLVRERFQGADPAADRVIELSIQIMLEELGPNLWEQQLERCVDYGHTFSKIFEMAPGADLMHGEGVNIDGFLCVLLAQRRGMVSAAVKDRIFAAMTRIGLPTLHDSVRPAALEQGLLDAVEHRNGAQRIPLLTGIGSSVCVNDITPEELRSACTELWAMHQQ